MRIQKARPLFIRLSILIVVLLLFASCRPQPKEQLIRIAYTQEPPYSLIKNNGEVGGLFPEVAKQLTEQLGYTKIDWVLMSFDELIPSLINERVDLIAAGMAVSEERLQVVCFAEPLVQANSAYIYLSNNTAIDPLLSIIEQNLSIAVIDGSVEYNDLKVILPAQYLTQYEDVSLAMQALENGLIDVFFLTQPSLIAIKQTSSFNLNIGLVHQAIITPQLTGFVFRPSDTKLLERWNKEQKRLKRDPAFIEKASSLGFLSEPTESEKFTDFCL